MADIIPHGKQAIAMQRTHGRDLRRHRAKAVLKHPWRKQV